MEKTRLIHLLETAKINALSPAEQIELNDFLATAANKDQFVSTVSEWVNATGITPAFREELLPVLENVLAIDRPRYAAEINADQSSTGRVRWLNTRWMRYAAALIVIAGTAIFLMNRHSTQPSVIVSKTPAIVPKDVAPGSNRAVLTLADGQKIVLNNALIGEVTKQNGSVILKRSDGRLEYQQLHDKTVNGQHPVQYNTMSTPNSGQYQLLLPDGSVVWLNAASSITFPTAFTGATREVTITGEAYFEVAKNAKAPFIVRAASETITVLGTHFNIHAYHEDGPVKTSLLEGSVKIAGEVLKPGQAYRDGKVMNTDVDQDVAWKNGVFNFNNVDLPSAMRQLARWYDLEVQFEGSVPDKVIRGEMGRDLTLSQVLKILGKMEMKFRLEGKKLIVSP